MTQVLDTPAPVLTSEGPCPCGSGLRGLSCCGLDLDGARDDHAQAWDVHIEEMARAYADGELQITERLALEILENDPRQSQALAALYNVCKDAGRLHAADILIRRLVTLYPNDALARLILTQFLLSQGVVEDAVAHARRLVQLAPEEARAHLILAHAFAAWNMPVAAEPHFRRALALKPETGESALAGLADVLRRLGRFEEARAVFRQADALGDNAFLLLNWATLEEADRKFEAAAALLDRAAALAPDHGRVALARANLHARTREYASAISELDALRESRPDNELGVAGLLEQGRTLDAVGRYDEAFAAFDAAKRKVRENGGAYQARQAEGLISRLETFFTPGRMALLPRARVRADVPQPIFIVGFPRSGTTLVEQMLTSHPDISGGDELPTINHIAHRLPVLLSSPLPYPHVLSELWLGDKMGEIESLRDHYLNDAIRHGAVTPGKRWFTDKMPLNETHLGLIHLLFPDAPIIHLIRHPLDVVLSVYSNGLTHGFNCASGLDTAAAHFARIAELVSGYRAAAPMNYVQVRYEALVEDLEGQARMLLDFIGAPFDPKVLAFQDNTRAARTASYAQVTEKLYDRSRYRHRHYARHLAEVRQFLEPVIRDLGYADV